MKKPLILALVIFLYVSTYIKEACAQQHYQIQGTIVSEKTFNYRELNLRLLRAKDSTLVKTEIPDASGHFLFENITEGEYRLVATHVAFQSWRSEIITASSGQDIRMVLKPRNTELKEVAVTATPPFITQQFDKTILNVENSIVATGSTVLDVLEKAPGVTIDQNDNLRMRGRQGLQVMVDGKRIPMSGSELANYLRGLPAGTVEKIELITNPSAKYDASGNSGMIDIRMKRDKRIGTNGTLSLSHLQGKLNKENGGLSLNHRNKGLNVFGSYNFAFRREFTNLDMNRLFDQSGAFTSEDRQENRFRVNYTTNSLRGGIDYSPSTQTTLGLTATALDLGIGRTSQNLSARFNAAHNPDSHTLTTSNNNTSRFNPALNLNLRQKLGKTGELGVDLDYAGYGTDETQNYLTNYYTPSNAILKPDYRLYGRIDGDLNIISIKSDYSKPLGKSTRLEAGAKSSWVKADNDVAFFDRSNGTDIPEPNKSNHFLYHENINAAYLNLSSMQKKWTLQSGLRMENTNSRGKQFSGGGAFDRSYVQLFPSGYAGYKISTKHELGLSVSRRINRPTYNQLNPFVFYINASTYNTGNPYLKPELSYSFELTHTFLQKFITKYNYSITTDNMISVLSPDLSQPNLVVQTDRNLARLNNYGVSISVPIKVGVVTSTNNMTAYYSQFTGNLVNTQLRKGKPSFNLNSSNSITLAPSLTAEVNGNYQSADIYAFMYINPIWTVSTGLQKQLWNRQGSVKLSLSDAFLTSYITATVRTNGYEEHFDQRRDSRVATLNFTWRFGKNTPGAPRRNNGGAEDEKRRAG